MELQLSLVSNNLRHVFAHPTLAEGIMALQDPELRALYDLKVGRRLPAKYVNSLGRYLCNVIRTLCLRVDCEET